MNTVAQAYSSTAAELVRRIVALADTNPEIRTMSSPWDLFKAGLKCDDIQPSFFQASWALKKAQSLLTPNAKAQPRARRARRLERLVGQHGDSC